MTTINLKRYYYPIYRKDTFEEVPDEVAEALEEAWHIEHRQENKKTYYKVLSLDAGDGVELHIASYAPSPEEIFMRAEEDVRREELLEHLREAMERLTPTQARRLHARFALGMKYREIAEAEGVSASDISASIYAGIKKLRKIFTKKQWMATSGEDV